MDIRCPDGGGSQRGKHTAPAVCKKSAFPPPKTPCLSSTLGACPEHRQRFRPNFSWTDRWHQVNGSARQLLAAADSPLLHANFRPSGRYHASSTELLLHLPPQSLTTVSFEFDREFLRFTQYPPDAARGLDATTPAFSYWAADDLDKLPAAGGEQCAAGGAAGEGRDCPADLLLARFMELSVSPPAGTVYSTAGLTVPISWPDFSMPYNIICVSCTLPAILFGTIVSGLLLPHRFTDPTVPATGGDDDEVQKPRPIMKLIYGFLRLADMIFGS